ncbi:unnamed protein product [Spirodela intermedia]|uniref:Uncharacterized protein n=2 Tax=Spirodela intermedia TaxID=51605 RepID=A0A7I8JA78_SPIIN|nr:unnamed protein product [Spirodela intermedia]CAA6667126.1 unnamed protein product [Spirodela intermedia]CAA7403945.1 unnamed protein product [Spirodela intermedia]
MSTAAADGYEGGIGGKLRTRQSRRAAATPYDRPPAAGRGLRGARIEAAASLAVAGRRGGWISKLVDPASTLITKGATRLFSSVFRKRLGAPPTAESPGSCPTPAAGTIFFFRWLFLSLSLFYSSSSCPPTNY